MAEWVGEGGVLGEVGVECILLLLGGSLNQVPDDGLDLLDYSRTFVSKRASLFCLAECGRPRRNEEGNAAQRLKIHTSLAAGLQAWGMMS